MGGRLAFSAERSAIEAKASRIHGFVTSDPCLAGVFSLTDKIRISSVPNSEGKMKTTYQGLALALCAAAYFTAMPVNVLGQRQIPETIQSAPPATKSNIPNARKEFRAMIQQYQGELDQLSKDVADVSKKLETQSGASIESGKAQVDALRQRLIQLGAQLQPDAPLPQNVERFQSWISAQLGRVNTQRHTLGVEFVEQLIRRYQQYQQEVTAEREKLGTATKAIDSLLGELTMSELRISELLVADDAGAAVQELKRLVRDITNTIERIRRQIRIQAGSPGV
jgi:peptidoglycan hydrolase CwlO-like protein